MRKILIVDDSSFMIKQMSRFLESHGYEVVSGKNGKEGTELYEIHKPDLMTLDISMPVMDGYDCLREILRNHPEARILMISGIDDDEKVNDCLQSGALDYILKPVKLHDSEYSLDLLNKLDKAVASNV